MFARMDPYAKNMNVGNPFLWSEALIFAISGYDSPHMMILPYDRYRNAWLPSIELPGNLKQPVSLVDFVGPRTFRAISTAIERLANEEYCAKISLLTFTIADDFKSIFMEEPLLSPVTIDNIISVFGVHLDVDGKLLVLKCDREGTVALRAMCGASAVEVARFPDRCLYHSCLVDGKLIFIDWNESFWSPFIYDFIEQKAVAVSDVRLHSRFVLNRKGKIVVYQEDVQHCTVYDTIRGVKYIVQLPHSNPLTAIHVTDCDHVILEFCDWDGSNESSVYMIWLNPPLLSEIALSCIHQNLPEKTRDNLRKQSDPLLEYRTFIRIVAGK